MWHTLTPKVLGMRGLPTTMAWASALVALWEPLINNMIDFMMEHQASGDMNHEKNNMDNDNGVLDI